MIAASLRRPGRSAWVVSVILSLLTLTGVSLRVLAVGSVTLYVDDNSTCTSACGSQASPYSTIQAAINDANAQVSAGTATAGIIQVAAGTYHEHIGIYPDVHVICAGPAVTTIDATGTGRNVVNLTGGSLVGRPNANFSIDGCRLTGGIGDTNPAYSNRGAGMVVFGDAVVSNNVITGNSISGPLVNWFGAGVYIATGRALISGNTITNNIANPPPVSGQNDSHGFGGGIYVLDFKTDPDPSTPVIEGNLIAYNLAQGESGVGGGIWVEGNPGTIIRRNMIIGNRALLQGGAINAEGTLTISDNLIYGNTTGIFGAGINLYQTSAQIVNNTIFGNSSTETNTPSGYSFSAYGAGIEVATLLTQSPPEVTLLNNLIVGNTVTSSGIGGGIHSDRTTPYIYNTNVYNNLKLPSTSSNVQGDYTDAQVIGQNGNVSVDPLFARAPLFTDATIAAGTTTTVAVREVGRYLVNHNIEYNNDGVARTVTAINTTTKIITFTPALAAASQAWKMLSDWGAVTNVSEDFHLQTGSPAIDTGSNTGVSQFDMDGGPRTQDGDNNGSSITDMGAYEVPSSDSDADGVPNMQDCAPYVASVQTAPGVVGDTVRAVAGPTAAYSWLRIPQANAYNVYRGTINGAFAYNHTCFEAASPDRVAQDDVNPAVGTGFYYLVSGVNSCAEGGLGSAVPSGTPRPNPSPCALSTADSDGDGLANIDDNCGAIANANQADQDHDAVGDVCDNCPAAANPDQADSNGDGIGNACQDGDGDGYPLSVDCNDQNPAIHPGAIEVCNGVDDDCNGSIDDGLGTATCGVGACQVTVNNCVNGSPQTCVPGAPSPETCNSIDDDCNGIVDDGFGTLTCGVGACQRTIMACPGAVCTPGTPGTETCNGIDDDCNGVVDNGFPNTDGDTLADCIDPDDDNDGIPDDGDNSGIQGDRPCAPGQSTGCDDNCRLVVNANQADLDLDGVGNVCDPDADGDSFTASGSGSPVTTVAASQSVVRGTLSGALADMQTSNDVYESIQETKSSNISGLEMRWTFTIPAKHLSVVYVEARQSASTDGDNFRFAYSTNGMNFIDMFTVKKTSDNNTPQYFALPLNISGSIVIRALDTNRASGNTLDTLYVDRIHIVGSDPADCNDLSSAINPAVFEGPLGAGVCSDAVDNNCDTKIDANDEDCKY
jgi:predicted outer membrane repeat protein